MKSKRKIYDYNPGIQSKNVVSYAEQLLAQKSAGARFEAVRAAAEAETNRVRYQEKQQRQLAANKFREQQRRVRIEGVEIDRRKAKTEARQNHLRSTKRTTYMALLNTRPDQVVCSSVGCTTVGARLSITLDNSERSYQRTLFLIEEKHDKMIQAIMAENIR